MIFSQAGTLVRTVTLKCCKVVCGIIVELHSAGASKCFPFLVNTHRHLARGLEYSIPIVMFKLWLSVFDLHWALMDKEFTQDLIF